MLQKCLVYGRKTCNSDVLGGNEIPVSAESRVEYQKLANVTAIVDFLVSNTLLDVGKKK